MSSPSRINDSDSESVSSIDSFDPPPTVETKTITRGEALRQAGNLFYRNRQPGLGPRTSSNQKWNLHYDLQMLNQITKFMDDDLEEWEYTVETPNRRKDMPWCGIGADILRFYVADLKPLRKGLPEDKRRTIVNNVRHGLSLFADFHDERVNAVEREAQAAIAGFVLREEAVSG
ncbi:unnamed protein product [Fusarium venenatum]|uniref:Uncharacterized protein n=1 Tax=Fusarium venenatum TaxID=56646 RepID=A0A2L2TGL0_9HYPO|nr:uncharacterized protein FVRRES_09315 [Fusarium venenatum]CEI69238.1 unnamed protein product [Fusarium venenatum]